MPKNLYKILLFLGAIFLLVLAVFFYKEQDDSGGENSEVTFLDVGQGDSILLKTAEGQNILIDGGPDKKAAKELDRLLPYWNRSIDLMILTHPHDDHVAGLVEVVRKFPVRKIIYTGVLHTSPTYLEWLKVIKEKNISLTIIDHRQKIVISQDVFFEVLYPDLSFLNMPADDLNNTSLVLRLIDHGNSFLFTGDTGRVVEDKLLSQKINLSADVLKISHHGSNSANSEEFLKKIHPKIAVIEVGKDNKYGHPSNRILKRLERLGVFIYRTDLDGSIGLKSGRDGVIRME